MNLWDGGEQTKIRWKFEKQDLLRNFEKKLLKSQLDSSNHWITLKVQNFFKNHEFMMQTCISQITNKKKVNLTQF